MASENVQERLSLLAESVAACVACELHVRRRNTVFGEGNPLSPLVLVGEGPGDNEDATGRPFVGKAGKLLDEALERNNISRDQVYICNTVKCRACDWSSGKPRNRPPEKEEVEACRPWLLEQLSLIKPQVILCIGAPSAKNLIRKDFKITAERGKLMRTDLARAIMATLHPAFILRNMSKTNDGGFGLLVADVGKAWDTAVRLAEREQAKLQETAQQTQEAEELIQRTLFDLS
jgi:uracil-DNA glycosylase family 4